MSQKPKTPSHQGPVAGPAPEELQTAYQIHTLARMLYGRFQAAPPPWAGPMQTMGPMTPYATGMIEPTAGPYAAPFCSPTACYGPPQGMPFYGQPPMMTWPTFPR